MDKGRGGQRTITGISSLLLLCGSQELISDPQVGPDAPPPTLLSHKLT